MNGEMTIRTETVRTLAMNIPCAECNAGVGEPCRRATGEPQLGLPVVVVHTARLTPIWVVYRIGYQHGRRDQREKNHGEDHQHHQD